MNTPQWLSRNISISYKTESKYLVFRTVWEEGLKQTPSIIKYNRKQEYLKHKIFRKLTNISSIVVILFTLLTLVLFAISFADFIGYVQSAISEDTLI